MTKSVEIIDFLANVNPRDQVAALLEYQVAGHAVGRELSLEGRRRPAVLVGGLFHGHHGGTSARAIGRTMGPP